MTWGGGVDSAFLGNPNELKEIKMKSRRRMSCKELWVWGLACKRDRKEIEKIRFKNV